MDGPDADTRTLPSPDYLPSDASLSLLSTSSAGAAALQPWWFEDGNVVLIPQLEEPVYSSSSSSSSSVSSFSSQMQTQTQPRTQMMCRVHRGILSHHSVVFRDMFLIPQPEEFEQIDGCPVVHLADSRRDLGVLLGTLYEAHKYFKSEHLLTFPDVSAMLRMGTKYQVDHVREEAISRLRLCFPSTLHTFPARNVYLQDPGFVLAEHISLTKKDAIGVVNLARAFDLDFLLPPAFYLCAQLDYDELVDGVEDACVPGGLARLSAHDLKVCIKGRTLLTKADVRSLQPLFFPVASPACASALQCVDVKRELVQELWYENLANPNALVEATHWLKSYAEARATPLCKPCVEDLMRAYDQQRQQTWKDLGRFFEVQPWPLPS